MAQPKLKEVPGSEPKIEIRSGVPLPPKAGAGRAGKYPWAGLQVGDSFFVPGVKSLHAPKALRDEGRSFETRTVTEDGEKGVGVWRAA